VSSASPAKTSTQELYTHHLDHWEKKNGSVKISNCFMKAGFGSVVSWDHNSQGNEKP
jgi:hypothetical protein